MVKRDRRVENTALPRLAPSLSAGLLRFLAAVSSLGAFFCTQVSRWNRCRVWASHPWPFCSCSTMVGRLFGHVGQGVHQRVAEQAEEPEEDNDRGGEDHADGRPSAEAGAEGSSPPG